MKELVFATNNSHKLKELRNLSGSAFKILSLKDINCHADIPETGSTLQENASLKSAFIYEKYKTDCFADDTGLEIEALAGRPGVYSARYAGAGTDFEKNIQKILSELQGLPNRKARFRTVISLRLGGEEYFFEGIVKGEITTEKRGSGGFGYDPVFVPLQHQKTFAQMSMEEKNSISHRAIATHKLVDFLTQYLTRDTQ